MKRISGWIALILVALVPAVSAADFEGVVQMKVTNGKTSQPLQYQVKEGFVRTDVQVAGGKSASIIMDLKKQQMIMLIPGQNMYMVYPLPSGLSAGGAAGTSGPPKAAATQGEMPQKTGETKTILGYTCTKYVSQANGASMEMWVTDELGNFAGIGGGGFGGRGAPQPAWEKMIAGQGFFPLLVTGKTASGNPFSLEVVSVEKQSLPDSVFAPPAGAREFNMGNMGGMMGGMMGGQRPGN